jgi:cation diffusion facilitator family transporter
MIVSSIINLFISRRLYKIAKRTKSIALEADALHLKADVYTSAGVAIGLFLIWFSGYAFHKSLLILDPIVAILVAVFILRESFLLLKKAFSPLVDISFLPEDIEKVKQTIEKHNLKYHNLRTRIAGNYRFIDFHLEFQKDTSVASAQTIRKNIKNELQSIFENTDVTIQTDTLKD